MQHKKTIVLCKLTMDFFKKTLYNYTIVFLMEECIMSEYSVMDIKNIDKKYYMNTFGDRIPLAFEKGKGI